MRIKVIVGDITELRADAIVNAANTSLLGGGGVDGAIHRAAGPELLQACIPFHGCRTGEARITPGFRLPTKFVIHTPGPVWHGGSRGEAALLAACYENSFRLAEENGCKTVAFPAISTGVYGYPIREATEIAVHTAKSWTGKLPGEVTFCCFSERDAEVYNEVIRTVTGTVVPSDHGAT